MEQRLTTRMSSPSVAGCYRLRVEGRGLEGEIEARGCRAEKAIHTTLATLLALDAQGPWPAGHLFGRYWDQTRPLEWRSGGDTYFLSQFPYRDPCYAATLMIQRKGLPFAGTPKATLVLTGHGDTLAEAQADLLENLRKAQKDLQSC